MRSWAAGAILASIAVAIAACASPELGGAAGAQPTSVPPLTSLAPAPTAPSTPAPTTTTLGIPSPPSVGDGVVCDLYDSRVDAQAPIASEAIVEASGIAASRTTPGVYWIVNDSGNDPVIYAVDFGGRELAAIELEGVLGFDWEDLAIGPGPDSGRSYLYVADIGDNLRLRSTVMLLRVPEPDMADPPASLADVETIRLAFPDRPEDSEALWVDPLTGDAFVVTKGQSDGVSVVYRASAETLRAGAPAPLEAIAEFRFGEDVDVTGADVSSDGAVLALRGYEQVWIWVRTDLGYEDTLAAAPCMAPSPDEVQGEALAFVAGELSYVTVSEGKAKPINLVTFVGS